MIDRKPKAKAYKADCIAECLGERFEAMYLRRCKDSLAHAWVQLADGTVCTIAAFDLLRLDSAIAAN